MFSKIYILYILYIYIHIYIYIYVYKGFCAILDKGLGKKNKKKVKKLENKLNEMGALNIK